MCNRADNYGISIEEVSERLRAEIAEGNYEFAEEVNAFSRPVLPIVVDYQGRKLRELGAKKQDSQRQTWSRN